MFTWSVCQINIGEFKLSKQNTSDLNELKKVFKDTKVILKSFNKISTQHANTIRLNDIQAKELGKKNIKKVNELSESLNHPTLNKMLQIMYNNFEIVNTNFNIFRAYTDEYYERFNKIESSFTKLLDKVESILTEKGELNDNKKN